MTIIRSRDLGTASMRPFGSALPPRAGGRIPQIPLITERPRRPQSEGPCPGCGDRFCGCDCEEETDG